MQVNLKEKSITDLKAMAYDTLLVIEQQKQNLQIINQEISERVNSIENQTAKVPTLEAVAE